MELPYFQINAFTNCLSHGNPAGVVPLEFWLPDELMQLVAAENDLSETAFFVSQDDRIELRWFTPTREVDLCGHATLATAHLLFDLFDHPGSKVVFETRSGELSVTNTANGLAMLLPRTDALPDTLSEEVYAALGTSSVWCGKGQYWIVELESQRQIESLNPDFAALARADSTPIAVTAQGEDCDFVSRFFAPSFGVDEDPVTGSAHCLLAPYWAEKLGRLELKAKQLSKRGGELTCRIEGRQVELTGQCRLYLEGKILLHD